MSSLQFPIVIVTVSASVFVFYGFLSGLYTLLNVPPNPCEMTYMFETPKYIPVPVDYTGAAKYKLFAYGEGRYARELFQGRFNGIPVLFIPGNAGCYKQVRSLASVAYRMHEDLHKPHHFNFFTIDFNEEFSGLYGGVLFTQARFVRRAIRAIQNLYSRPTKVILIGHSMGGLVAKSVFVDQEFPYDSVDVILTLSTPHNDPPYGFDWHISKFYSDWDDYAASHPSIWTDKMFISIGSGIRDTMVQPHQTLIYTGSNVSDVINVLATHIPEVQVSPDHLQMVWCRQLVKKLCRVLFDLIDTETLLLTEDVGRMRSLSRQALVGGVGGSVGQGTRLQASAATIHVKELQHYSTVTSREGWKKFVVPVRDTHQLHILAHNPPQNQWLFYCASTDNCVDVSSSAVQYPDFIFLVSASENKGLYLVFLNSAHGRQRKGTRSSLFIQHQNKGPMEVSNYEKRQTVISGTLTHTLNITSISSSDYWVGMRALIKETACSHMKSTVRLPAAKMEYGIEDTYSSGSEGELEIMVQLLTATDETSKHNSEVVMVLDPACSYTIEIESEALLTAANLIRYKYSVMGGLLLYGTLAIVEHLVKGSSLGISAPLYTFTQDSATMLTFLLLVSVKLVRYLLPATQGALGLDWMTIEPEIMLVGLLVVFTLLFLLSLLIHLLLLYSSKLAAALGLADSRHPYFSVGFQLFLCCIGLLSSGSLVNVLNLLFLLFYVATRKNVSNHLRVVAILQIFGVSLQLPVLLSWLKNVSVSLYWLEGDWASRVTLLITCLSCSALSRYPSNQSRDTSSGYLDNHPSPPHIAVSRALSVAKWISLSFAVSRSYLVVGLLYAALGAVTAGFIAANFKTKVS